MSWFELEAEDIKVAEEAYAPKGGNNTGEKVVTLKYCYLLPSTSSKAVAFVIEYEHENKFKGTEKYWFINKETGKPKSPDGKPTFGSLQVADFLGALKLKAESIKPVKTKIKVFGEEREMDVFRELYDRTVRCVIQAKEEESYKDGSIIEVDEVIGWFDVSSRKNRKELEADSDAVQIEKDIKRSATLRKLKAKKEEPKKAEDNGSWNSSVDTGNPWS